MSLDCDRPESFLGLMMGLEGVSDGFTILHGPTGCKFYPASLSEDDYRFRDNEVQSRNAYMIGMRYFFGQPRIPCTYLDMGRFVSGGKDRLKDLYAKVEGLKPGFIGIINSPGASLIGEDLESVKGSTPTATIDHAEYSGTCADGFQEAILAIIDTIHPVKTEKRSGVNLVGISITHLNWQDTVEELTALLGLCGIGVNCVIGAGWSTDDVRDSASAELNVLVYPEYGDRVAREYEERYGVPYYSPDEGAPVGFGQVESWIKGVCARLGKDPSPALEHVRAARARTASVLRTMEAYHLLPKGRTFSAWCDGSTAYAVSRFLYSYLGMIPVAIRCPNGSEWGERAVSFFASKNIPVSDDPDHTETDVLVSSGSICASAKIRGIALGAVEVETPESEAYHTLPEPPIGLTGTMRLLDAVLNTVADRQRFR